MFLSKSTKSTIQDYTHLYKYLILTNQDYETETSININWQDIDQSLHDFTPITDSFKHEELNFRQLSRHFKMRLSANRYKVLPSRKQVSESVLLYKAMRKAVANSQIHDQDFILFTLPNIKLCINFAEQITTLLQFLSEPEQQYVDCVILDYGYLQPTENLIRLYQDHNDYDAKFSQDKDTIQIFQNLTLIPTSIKELSVSLNQDINNNSTFNSISVDKDKPNNVAHDNMQHAPANINCKQEQILETTQKLTVATPTIIGIPYSHCFLIRKSRIKKVLFKRRPQWLIYDFKRYIPITRILIVTPSLVITNYPRYDLSQSKQDILELNRLKIKHTLNEDKYRQFMFKKAPWLYTNMQSKSLLTRLVTLGLQRMLYLDF